jgi:hypothetical protein
VKADLTAAGETPWSARGVRRVATVAMLSDVALIEGHDLEKPHILAHRHPHLPVIGV